MTALRFVVLLLAGLLAEGATANAQISNVLTVPEPSTIALLGTGIGALAIFRRRKKKK